MPEYRRFISYIYRYMNGKKGRNCGYVKAEIRGNICRLQMHLERSGQERQPLKVYGFVREGAYLLGLMLGETAEKGKSCDFQTATPAQSFADTVYTTQQVCGIWLTGLENETYITIWDDEPVDLEQFVTELPRKEKHVEEEQQKEGQLTEALPIQEQNVPELAAEQACVKNRIIRLRGGGISFVIIIRRCRCLRMRKSVNVFRLRRRIFHFWENHSGVIRRARLYGRLRRNIII